MDVPDGTSGTRTITVEAWYPAVPGSESGRETVSYDIREHVPPKQQAKLVDAANVTSQACECYRDLPVADGSFPVLVMIHGTAAFRTASQHQQSHWASRGFIVFAADHPGIQLKDLLGIVDLIPPPKTDQAGDARGMLQAIAGLPEAAPDFAPLGGHVDLERVGVSGHSAGGMACKDLGDVADVLVPMAGYSPVPGPRLKSTLVLAARNDTIVNYELETASFASCEASPKRFASVDALGHLFCSDLCWIGESAGGIVKIAEDHGIEVAKAFESLGQNGCAYLNPIEGTAFLEPKCGWQVVNYASSAAFEEKLRCDAGMIQALSNMKTAMPIPAGCSENMVFDYQESLGMVV
jgi:dienelactone hydrolase